MGNLNVNEMRDKRKANTIIEFIRSRCDKNLDVIFLQETVNNGWGNECVLNHGTNLSAGDFSFFFSPALKVKILSKK